MGDGKKRGEEGVEGRNEEGRKGEREEGSGVVGRDGEYICSRWKVGKGWDRAGDVGEGEGVGSGKLGDGRWVGSDETTHIIIYHMGNTFRSPYNPSKSIVKLIIQWNNFLQQNVNEMIDTQLTHFNEI